MSPDAKIIVGALLLAVCCALGGAAAVLDIEWRLARRRREKRRARTGTVDLTGTKPS